MFYRIPVVISVLLSSLILVACDDGGGGTVTACPASQVTCDGLCVDPLTDNRHCGAGADCVAEPGVACQAGFVCDGTGRCALSCQEGLVACQGTCVDPDSSNQFCGAGPDCALNPGVACQHGYVCDGAGQCALSCQDGLVACEGTCIDPDTSDLFCGAGPDCVADPGEPCGEGRRCDGAGVCQLACPTGFVDCGGACVDPDHDRRFCGAGPDCVADPGVECPDGFVCDGTGTCALSCQTGLVSCGGTCINPDTDRLHCGAGPDCDLEPGVECPDGHLCDGAGGCALSCQEGLVDCGGTCINPDTDRLYCGAGPDCYADPGLDCLDGYICNGEGQCALSCQPGLVDCGGTCIDPDFDRRFCGAGPDCDANPGLECADGFVCDGAGHCVASCKGGLIDCGGTCVDAQNDPLFCGAGPDCDVNPGELCGPGQFCSGGACTASSFSSCTEYLAAGSTANGFYNVVIGGAMKTVYCDMAAGGHMLFSVVHNWGEWGAGMTIVMRDRLAPGVGSIPDWDATCGLFGRTKYAGGWMNTGQTYSMPAYTVYADSQHWWNTQALSYFPTVTYNDILILQDALSYSCWAHYAEVGSLQSFGSPAGSGYAFCRNGNTASKRYHIYLCL